MSRMSEYAAEQDQREISQVWERAKAIMPTTRPKGD